MIFLIPIAVWLISGPVAAGYTLLGIIGLLFVLHMLKD